KGLQQIHAAGHEARRRAVNQGSSKLGVIAPGHSEASSSWCYTAAVHGSARRTSRIFAGRTSACGTISLLQLKTMLVDDQTCFVLSCASGTSHVLLRRPSTPCRLHQQETQPMFTPRRHSGLALGLGLASRMAPWSVLTRPASPAWRIWLRRGSTRPTSFSTRPGATTDRRLPARRLFISRPPAC